MIITLILPILALITASHCETTENEIADVEPISEANSTMTPLLEATASKLIRYRRKPPPVTYYRYKTQTFKRPRPRVKFSKIKYGPPIYNIPETNYYKSPPEIYTTTQSYKHSFSYDDAPFEGHSEYAEIESIPVSNYESESMDLDFYSDSYSKKSSPPYEYPKPQKAYNVERPHKVYGVPKKPAYDSYNSYPDVDKKPQPEIHYEVSYHEEPPSQSYGSPLSHHEKDNYEEHPSYGAPPKGDTHQPEHVSYQEPENKYQAPPSSYHPQESHTNGGPYSVYDKKLPNSGYSHNNHFAEPPTDIHITYSPSYDPSHNSYKTPPSESYVPPSESYGSPSETYGPPSETYGPPSDSYGPPDDKFKPPSNNYGPPTDSYEPPSDSYGPPSKKQKPPSDNYGPPPNDKYGPPNNKYGSPSNSYGPPDHQQKSHRDYQASGDSYHQSSGGHFAEPPESYLPPPHKPEDLPLNKHHMPPGYDYPKSSYEVPIYDPVPFESTTTEHDFFPPNHIPVLSHNEQLSESNNHIQQVFPHSNQPKPSPPTTTMTTTTTIVNEPNQQANNKFNGFISHNHRSNYIIRPETTSKFFDGTEELGSHTSEAPSTKYLNKILSSTSTFRPRRKRKRTKTPVTEKHNLDTPELKQAFDGGHDQSGEQSSRVSNIKENFNSDGSPLRPLTNFSPSNTWNPLRIRPSQTYPQRGQRTSVDTLNDLKNIEVLSIEKSHSHSYYAGTVPQNPRTRADAVKMSTIPSTTFKLENSSQPTRGVTIDKSYFKVKDDDECYYDGTGELPKNHKLF